MADSDCNRTTVYFQAANNSTFSFFPNTAAALARGFRVSFNFFAEPQPDFHGSFIDEILSEVFSIYRNQEQGAFLNIFLESFFHQPNTVDNPARSPAVSHTLPKHSAPEYGNIGKQPSPI